MHNFATLLSMLDLLEEHRSMQIKRCLAAAAGSLLLVFSGYSGVVVAAEEQPMDMPMDHGSMDHGDHEQHMAMMKKGSKFTRSVQTYVAPGVKMLDMNGKEVSLPQELSGDKPIFLNFIFTTCTTICPVMSASFQQVQELLGTQRGKVRMVSISIDPEHDTPANLKEYASKYRADSQWTLLTGTVGDSIEVQKAYGVYSGDKMNHQPVTFLKAKGSDNSWVRLDGLVDAADIVKEYKKLKAK